MIDMMSMLLKQANHGQMDSNILIKEFNNVYEIAEKHLSPSIRELSERPSQQPKQT